jgi:23S rRNA (pseudouridine1915-N3)-methyltransferase
MMQVRVVAIGKIKENFLREGIAEYEKRLRPYLKLQIVELAEEKRPQPASPAHELSAMEKEGERILAAVPDGMHIVALDRNGKAPSSRELAALFREWELSGRNQITFIIGGDLGLSSGVLAKSTFSLSLSKMTFTHPMARLLLLEQVYRACRINSGEPYHR